MCIHKVVQLSSHSKFKMVLLLGIKKNSLQGLFFKIKVFKSWCYGQITKKSGKYIPFSVPKQTKVISVPFCISSTYYKIDYDLIMHLPPTVVSVQFSLLFQILFPQTVCKILGAENLQISIYKNTIIELINLPKRNERKKCPKMSALFHNVFPTL